MKGPNKHQRKKRAAAQARAAKRIAKGEIKQRAMKRAYESHLEHDPWGDTRPPARPSERDFRRCHHFGN